MPPVWLRTQPTKGSSLTRKVIGGVLAGALLLCVPAIALADSGDTLMKVGFTTKSKQAGTKKKPRTTGVSIQLNQSTRSGAGQPATSSALNITLPKELRFKGGAWPKKQRCDPIKANAAMSDRVCPKGSGIGSGHVTATAGNGALSSEIAVRAYVTKSGDLGLWLDTTTPLPIHQMLIGKVTGGRTIKVAIPSNIQQPLAGVKSAIRTLRFSLARGVESTGCPAAKQWKLSFQNVYDDGSRITGSDTASCRR
jgi:hypothetical protein